MICSAPPSLTSEQLILLFEHTPLIPEHFSTIAPEHADLRHIPTHSMGLRVPTTLDIWPRIEELPLILHFPLCRGSLQLIDAKTAAQNI